MKQVVIYICVVVCFSICKVHAQDISYNMSQDSSLTDFESNFISKLQLVRKINFETGQNKYSDKTQLCKANKIIVDGKYLEEFGECNNVEYTAGTYSLVYGKWFLIDLYLGICPDPESDYSLGSFSCLDLRDKKGQLLDRLVIDKTIFIKPDTLEKNFCTTEFGEIKVLQTWVNKTSFKQIQKLTNRKDQIREELYPTLPRSCYKLLTYKIDSLSGKFILQTQIETGTLLKEFRNLSFDKDSPLYRYR